MRVDDKIYLYLKNINDKDPFGILHYHGQSICQFRLTRPVDLDYFRIEFKDSNGNSYDFHNLPHSISLQLEVLKKEESITNNDFVTNNEIFY